MRKKKKTEDEKQPETMRGGEPGSIPQGSYLRSYFYAVAKDGGRLEIGLTCGTVMRNVRPHKGDNRGDFYSAVVSDEGGSIVAIPFHAIAYMRILKWKELLQASDNAP